MRKPSQQMVTQVLTATGVLVLTGAVLVTGAVWSDPQTALPLTTTTVDLQPPAARLVCPGPLLLPQSQGTDAAYDPSPAQAENILQASVIAANPAGGVDRGAVFAWHELDEDVAGAQEVIAAPLDDPRAVSGDVWVHTALSQSGSVLHVLEPEDRAGAASGKETAEPGAQRQTPLANAGVVSWVPSGDVTGLASAPCQSPGFERWHVGFTTSVGHSAQLVIQNPGFNPITVDIEVWGAVGERAVEGQRTVTIPPLSSAYTLIEGLVSSERRAAIRLTATGGPFTAYIQTSELRGLEPAGVDLLPASALPGAQTYIAGIKVRDSDISEPDPAFLFIVNPGDADTHARIEFTSANGPVDSPELASVLIPANSVAEVSLAGLPSGIYTASITAESPVVVSARLSMPASADAPRDIAWATPSDVVPAGEASILTVPDAARGTVSISAVSGRATTAQVTVYDRGGRVLHTHDVEILEGTTSELDMATLSDASSASTGSISITGAEDLVWGAVLETPTWAGTHPNAVAVLKPSVSTAVQSQITVQRQGVARP